MFLAFFIYSFLLITSLLLTCKSYKYTNRTYHIFCLFAIIICSIILGLRENVGVDFISYKEDYLDEIYWYEPGFVAIQKGLKTIEAHYSFLFGIIAFLQFIFFYKSFDDKRHLLPYALFFFFTYGQLFTNLNIIRQGLAISILLYSIKYIYEHKFKAFLFYIGLASLFHITSIIFLLAYWLGNIKLNFIKQTKIQLLLYVVSIIISFSFQTIIVAILSNENLGLLSYKYSNIESEKFELNIGLGVWLMRFLDIILIIYYHILKKKCDNRFLVYYNLFYFGILLYNISGIHMLFSRLWGGFLISRLIVFAYLLHYTFTNWKHILIRYRFLSFFVIVISIALFIASIIKSNNLCSPFQFIEL